MKATVVAYLAVALATPALAQDSGWSFALSPYAWTPPFEVLDQIDLDHD